MRIPMLASRGYCPVRLEAAGASRGTGTYLVERYRKNPSLFPGLGQRSRGGQLHEILDALAFKIRHAVFPAHPRMRDYGASSGAPHADGHVGCDTFAPQQRREYGRAPQATVVPE